MRLTIATLTTNTEIAQGMHLLEVHAPQLARAVQPGQYCMLRCCDNQASDPFLRRPFFVHEVEPGQGLCRFLVYERGRASSWLARQQAGMPIDVLGPLGHGWEIRPEVRNLLLIGEEPIIAAVICLARSAIERELAVTLLSCVSKGAESYPAALLPPEVEYQVCASVGEPGEFKDYLAWADAVCCAVSHETLQALSQVGRRWRDKQFAQVALHEPFICGSGACLSCQVDTRHGSRLICRDGPVFAFSELAER